MCLELFAQIPFVYNLENSGAGYPPASLPALNQLPVVDPLPDPFMWSSGRGRSKNFRDWERRRNEIKAEIEHFEIGTKPGRPQSITANFTRGTNGDTLTVDVSVNGQTLTLKARVTFQQVVALSR